MAFRLAAIGFAVLAILVAVVQSRRPAALPAVPAPRVVRPIDQMLARCQALGEAGAQDPECLRAWADQRSRFLQTAPSTSGKVR